MGRKGSRTLAALDVPGAYTPENKAIVAFRRSRAILQDRLTEPVFEEERSKYAELVRARMAASGFGTLWAALALCDDSDDPEQRLWIQAAAIEMWEGRIPVGLSACGKEQPEGVDEEGAVSENQMLSVREAVAVVGEASERIGRAEAALREPQAVIRRLTTGIMPDGKTMLELARKAGLSVESLGLMGPPYPENSYGWFFRRGQDTTGTAQEGNQRGAAMVAGSAGIGNDDNGKGSKDMESTVLDDAQVAQDAVVNAPAGDGEPKLIRVVGRLEKITMPTERGKELQLAVVLPNTSDNRLALAMMDGSDVSLTATEREEVPAIKIKVPEECDDQPFLPFGDGDEGDNEGGEE